MLCGGKVNISPEVGVSFSRLGLVGRLDGVRRGF